MFSPFHTLVNVRKALPSGLDSQRNVFLAKYSINTTIRTSCERSSPSMQPFVPAFPSFSGLFQLVPRCKLSSVQVCSVFIFFWNVLRCSSDFPGQWLPLGWRITYVHPISASPSRLVSACGPGASHVGIALLCYTCRVLMDRDRTTDPLPPLSGLVDSTRGDLAPGVIGTHTSHYSGDERHAAHAGPPHRTRASPRAM